MLRSNVFIPPFLKRACRSKVLRELIVTLNLSNNSATWPKKGQYRDKKDDAKATSITYRKRKTTLARSDLLFHFLERNLFLYNSVKDGSKIPRDFMNDRFYSFGRFPGSVEKNWLQLPQPSCLPALKVQKLSECLQRGSNIECYRQMMNWSRCLKWKPEIYVVSWFFKWTCGIKEAN